MAKTVNITDEQRRAIDNYGDRIVTVEDPVIIVRKRPGMYGGGIGNSGFLTLIREAYQNATDQVLDPSSPANYINTSYDERTLEYMVTDNGLGFPFNDMVRMVTEMHTSKNFAQKRKGEYGSGLHGVGIKVVNALSLCCRIESYRYDGSAMAIDLEKGYLKKGPYKIPNKEKFQGSRVSFIPDTEIMGELALGWKEVYILIKRLLSLTPIGTTVDFKGIDSKGVEHNEHIVNTDGIITELIDNVKFPMGKPIIISHDTGEQKLDLAFMYDAGGEDGPSALERVTAFCNMCPTIAGPHIVGVTEGICKWFTSYMNNIYLANSKSKTRVAAADIKCGLNVMIAAACLEPIFIGQAKEQLGNKEMQKFCSDVVRKGLDEWSKSNPNQLSKMADYFKNLADIRTRAENSKAKVSSSYVANVLSGLPEKFIAPTERNYEFIIVEGDSAKGPVADGRDATCQGLFPIRGKIINPYGTSKDKFFANAEVDGIFTIILGGKKYWKTFDPIKDVEWDKIIFMADADVDGAHIASLLLRIMVRYAPQLIEAGKIYKAIPPLYANSKDGKKFQYYTDTIDFVRFVQKNFVKTNKLCYPDGMELSGKDITVLFMVNEDYSFYLNTIANTFAVEPGLLEIGLYNYINGVKIAKVAKDIKAKYRFMNAFEQNGQTIYDGTIKESNFLPVGEKLLNDCKPLLDIMRANVSLNYKLNGKPSTLYDIMNAFEASKPSGIRRYKGLGEMLTEQLVESTLGPNSNRTLIRYTFEDVKNEIEAIREFESDRSKLMQFVGTVKRTDLLE